MKELDLLRDRIDNIDSQIARLFEERMKVSREIGLVKLKNNLQILDKEREALVKTNRENLMDDKSLLPYWNELLDCILKLSKEYQWTLKEDSPYPRK